MFLERVKKMLNNVMFLCLIFTHLYSSKSNGKSKSGTGKLKYQKDAVILIKSVPQLSFSSVQPFDVLHTADVEKELLIRLRRLLLMEGVDEIPSKLIRRLAWVIINIIDIIYHILMTKIRRRRSGLWFLYFVVFEISHTTTSTIGNGWTLP